MKKTLTVICATALLGCGLTKLNAQQAMGLVAGNHNAPYSAFLNPANMFPDKNRVYINFWGANVGFTNNFLTYDAPFGLGRMANGTYPDAYKTQGGLLDFDQNWLQWEKNNNQKLYYLNEVYGPSINFRVSRKTALGFGLRGISGLSMTGITPEVSRLLRYGLDSSGLAFTGENKLDRNVTYSNGKFSIATEKYQEWYFSLATVTKDKGPHFVKWGATGKLLLGMGAAGVNGSGFDYQFNNNNQLVLNNANARFYHTDDQSAATTLQYPLGFKFDFLNGAGAGMDLGFVYEYRPASNRKTVRDWWNCADEVKNDYDWKFGASITDLGFIAYNGSTRTLKNNASAAWTINQSIVNQKTWNQGFDDRFTKVDNGFFDDSAVNAGINDRFAVATPMALNAQLDLNLKNNFYVGMNWSQSLKSQGSAGLRKSSYVSVVPRYETEHAEIGMPITLTRDYSALNVGLYGRLGPVIVGTDNLAGLASYVGNGSFKAANVYFAVRMQIPACGWKAYEHDELVTDTVKADTLYKSDTVSFWKRDTVVKVVRDTVKIQKTDTVKVIEYRNKEVVVTNTQKDLELKKKEDALNQKEEDLKAREDAVAKKENTNMGKSDCDKRIGELEDQLRRERDLHSKLNSQYQDEKAQKEKLAISIASLENQLRILESENAALKSQVSDQQAQIYKLQQEIARLKATSKPCDAQVKTLDSLLALEELKNAENQKEISKQKAIVTGKQQENDAQKKRIADLEEEIRVLKLKGSDNNSEQLAKLQADLDKEKAKSNDLAKQLEDLRKEYQYEIDKNKELTEKLKNCGSTDEAAKLKAELDAQKKKCDDLELKIKTLEAENTAVKGENSTLKAKVSGLEKDLADLKLKLDTESKKVLDLQEQLKNCGDADQIGALKAQVDELKKQNSDKDAQISGLKAEKAKLESDLSTAKAKITSLETDLKNCQDKDCSEIEAQLAEYKQKYSDMGNQYDAVYAEYNGLLADYKKLQGQLADCQKQLKECGGSSDEIAKLEAEVSKLKLTITELNGQLDGKQKSLDQLQEDYDQLTTEKIAMQKQITSLNAQIKALNAQVADLQAQLKACKEAGQPDPSGGSGGGN